MREYYRVEKGMAILHWWRELNNLAIDCWVRFYIFKYLQFICCGYHNTQDTIPWSVARVFQVHSCPTHPTHEIQTNAK